jgi:hypothetical protein
MFISSSKQRHNLTYLNKRQNQDAIKNRFMCWGALLTPHHAGTAPSEFPLKAQLLQFVGGHYLSFDYHFTHG